MNRIVKHGLVIVRDGSFLINRKYGTKLFLMPGGRPEAGETIEECLVREIKEEHQCEVIKDSVKFFGIFEDMAANEPNTIVSINLYIGNILGEPQPSSEVEEQRWFNRDSDQNILSPLIKNKILPALIDSKII